MTYIKSCRILSLCLYSCVVVGTQLTTFCAEKVGADRWLAALHDQRTRLDVAYDFRLLEPVTKQTVISLVDALKDKDPFVRSHVADALGEIGKETEIAVPALISCLRDKDVLVRGHATIALSKLGSASVPSLIKLLSRAYVPLRPRHLKRKRNLSSKEEFALSDYAALALKQIGASAFDGLVSVLKNKPGLERQAGRPCKDEFIFPRISDLRSIDRSDQDDLLDYTRSFDLDDRHYYSDRTDHEECFSSEQRYARYLLRQTALPTDSAVQLMFHSTDRATRLWAVVALRNNGKEANVAVPALAKALNEDDPELSLLVVEALGKYGGKAVPTVLIAMKNKSAGVRLSALRQLRKLQLKPEYVTSDIVAALMLALQDSDENVRERAAATLGSLGPAAKEAIPALARGLKDSDLWVRKEAASAIGEIGEGDSTGLAALINALNDNDYMVSTEASSSLARLRPASRVAIPELLKLRRTVSRDSDDSAHLIGWDIQLIDENDPSIIPALLKDLSDPEPNIAATAAYSLGYFDRGNPTVMAALIAALNSEHSIVRKNAVEGLGSIGPSASEAIPALVSALKKDEQNLHSIVPDALRKIGIEAIPALLEALLSSNSQTRIHSLYELEKMETNDPRLVPVLIQRLKDTEQEVRWKATEVLGNFGMVAKAALPALLPLLRDHDKYVRLAAIEALGKLDANANTDILVLLNDKEPTVRVAAAAHLVKRGASKKKATQVILDASRKLDYSNSPHHDLPAGLLSEEFIPTILDSLRRGNARARTDAALWLAHRIQLPRQSIPILISALKDKNPKVKRWIITALSRSDAAHKIARPALVKALRDNDAEVRRVAAEALFDMGYDPAEIGLSLNTAIYDRYIHQFVKESLGTIQEDMRPPSGVMFWGMAMIRRERDFIPRLRWWPPPKFSDWYVLPRERLGTDQQTLADIHKRISGALSERDYQGQAIFEIPDGFALVTKVERIYEDGREYPAPDRWTNVKLSPKTWSEYWGSLWMGRPGHFRLLMFVVTTHKDLQGSNDQLSENDARGLFLQGSRILPNEIGHVSYSNHQCHVVVYHFEKKNGVVKVIYDDPLDAMMHLKKSGLSKQLNLE
jgi:HEAT repeat protein